MDTSSTLDDHVNANATYNCSATNYTCLKLQNGGVLYWQNTIYFGKTATQFGSSTALTGIYFLWDPDGVRGTNGTADHPSKAVCMYLYYNGTILSRSNGSSNTTAYDSVNNYYFFQNPGTYDPSWFGGF